LAAVPQNVSSIAFLPDGKTVITGHQDGSLTLVPAKSDPDQRATEKLYGHTGRIADIAPFSNNRHMLTASLNGEIWMWDVQTAQMWKNIGRHEAGVGSIRLLAGIQETRFAVCGCLDGLLQIWDFEERRVVHEVGSCSRQGKVAVSSDGRWIAVFGESNGLAENAPKSNDAVTVNIWRIPVLPDPRPGFPGFQDPSPQKPQEVKPVPKVVEPKPSNEIPFLEVVHEFAGHSGPVTSVCMTADVRFGFSAGGYPNGDGVIRNGIF
jgi:WD40 repeat protein